MKFLWYFSIKNTRKKLAVFSLDYWKLFLPISCDQKGRKYDCMKVLSLVKVYELVWRWMKEDNKHVLSDMLKKEEVNLLRRNG